MLFDADQLEALAACTELINTGRSRSGEGLRGVADVQDFARRYAFYPRAATTGDVALLRAHRARLDTIARACEAGDTDRATVLANSLLAETGAVPQIASHDGRGPHIHVSRSQAPLADRIAAQLAMGLAEPGRGGRDRPGPELRIAGLPGCVRGLLAQPVPPLLRQSHAVATALHVAAYRARKSAQEQTTPH